MEESHEDAFGNMIEAGAIAFVSASANYAIGQGFNTNSANVSAGTRIGNVLAHAALGCAMAEAGGGKCGAGALSGAITAGVDQIDTGSFGGGFAMAMVAGCAGSAAGGGSCSRGAASSALIYLYNAHGDEIFGANAMGDPEGGNPAGGVAITTGVATFAVLAGGAIVYDIGSGAANFFVEATYTDKVIMQMGKDAYHGFPVIVDSISAQSGKVTRIVGGDGVKYLRLQIDGAVNGVKGVFEFIKDSAGYINHRLFRPK